MNQDDSNNEIEIFKIESEQNKKIYAFDPYFIILVMIIVYLFFYIIYI